MSPNISLLYSPLILGAGGMVAWISIRNDSISGRIRELNKEHWSKTNLDPERASSIVCQVKILRKDYARNKVSLVFGIFALAFFYAQMIAREFKDDIILAKWSLHAGLFCVLFCLILMIIEISKSGRALDKDIKRE